MVNRTTENLANTTFGKIDDLKINISVKLNQISKINKTFENLPKNDSIYENSKYSEKNINKKSNKLTKIYSDLLFICILSSSLSLKFLIYFLYPKISSLFEIKEYKELSSKR